MATTTALKLLSGMFKTPIGRRLIDESRALDDARRLEKAVELKSLRNSPRFAPLRQAARAAADKLAEAVKALRQAEKEARETAQAYERAANGRYGREQQLQSQLRALAPPEIARFIRYLGLVQNAIQEQAQIFSSDKQERGGKIVTIPRPKRLVDAEAKVGELLRVARRRAEEMEVSELPLKDIVAELQRMRDGIETAANGLGERFDLDTKQAAAFEVDGAIDGPDAA